MYRVSYDNSVTYLKTKTQFMIFQDVEVGLLQCIEVYRSVKTNIVILKDEVEQNCVFKLPQSLHYLTRNLRPHGEYFHVS